MSEFVFDTYSLIPLRWPKIGSTLTMIVYICLVFFSAHTLVYIVNLFPLGVYLNFVSYMLVHCVVSRIISYNLCRVQPFQKYIVVIQF